LGSEFGARLYYGRQEHEVEVEVLGEELHDNNDNFRLTESDSHVGQRNTHSSSLPSSSNDDGGLSDSDPDVSSDDDGCSSEAEKQGGLSARMNIPWDPVDEQRLVAWKKEGKPWDWVFKKFPGRTHPAIQYARAGAWFVPEASKLPPTGGQRAAQALCAYLSAGTNI
jgi:hypothetical protein